MFSRTKGWIPGIISKPRNPHSLEQLKYLYGVLCKNQTVTENNRSLLVETLRSISEILIWGDQNDSSVFDFFLEKNMLSFFLRYLRQKYGRFICVQLLQTLNILFENISNETSLYYLLSNNHINSIIVHKFDFSDEEVMAYYISFLKTLSLKLNKHTIHFFYNEHTNDFALYTEAIKFFKHSESMVRIAVRTITLNVFKVDDKAMLRYIKDRTAAPYFSNLVWFIGMHILDLDNCVRNDADHQSRNWLADLVAEHLDHLHYLNDILCINIDALNDVLSDQLLNRLLIPLYVYSLTKRKKHERSLKRKHVSSVVSLFLLSQVFLIISYAPLVRQLAEIIFQGEVELKTLAASDSPQMMVREFAEPEESLEKTLESNRGIPSFQEGNSMEDLSGEVIAQAGNSMFYRQSMAPEETSGSGATPGETEEGASVGATDAPSPVEVNSQDADVSSPNQNSTDEEKLSSLARSHRIDSPTSAEQAQASFSLENRPYLEAVFNALECSEKDYESLFALCLLYAMGHNEGIHQGLMDTVLMPTDKSETKDHYNVALVERLIRIITLSCQHDSKVRLCTLELSIQLLKQLVYTPDKTYLHDRHLATIEAARESSMQILRNFYKSEEIFLDMFEDEYRDMKKPLNVEYLTMDASILLPPTGTPLTGIEFSKRLPCGEVERARRAIRVFFLVRDLSFSLLQEEETQLPLTKEDDCVKVNEILDLNNSDLIACTVMNKERRQEKRFLVIDSIQMILVEPDTKRLGWGVVRFVGLLQDVEVTGDKEDSRSLHIAIHRPASSHHAKPVPLLSARFVFDDHIRCMAAKQRLSKGRIKARQLKMQMIEKLLDIPSSQVLGGNAFSAKSSRAYPGRGHPVRVQETPLAESPTSVSASSGSFPVEPRSSRRSLPKTPAGTSQSSEATRGSKKRADDVEMAEDAFAYQSFNQGTGARIGVRHSSPSNGGSNSIQEIPLEDMSRRKKRHGGKKFSDARVAKLVASSSPTAGHGRSHSHSPKRQDKAKVGRERSTSVKISGNECPGGGIPVSSSPPIPIPGSPSHSRSRHSSTSSDDGDFHTNRRPHLRSGSSQSPKTLRPADAPAMSLVFETESEPCKADVPKLIAPAEIDIIRGMSDTSSVSTSSSRGEQGSSSYSCGTVTDELASKPKFAYDEPSKASAEMSNASVESVSIAKESSTSDQLTKFAQLVHEHYSFDDEQEKSVSQRESDTC